MTKHIKALEKSKADKGLWMIDDYTIPEIGPDDVLVKVQKSAICGTDLHIYNWDKWAQKTIPVPMVVGHEYVGTIAQVGDNVSYLKEGDRVTSEGHIVCGFCRNCRAGRRHMCRNTKGVGVNRPGSFAEYVAVPAENIIPLPASIPDDIAAILDPLGNAVHTALAFDLVGEDVLITGAGPIGLMAVKICQHIGARHVVITDVNPYRLALAEKMGATCAVNVAESALPQVMEDLDMSEGFDVALEMSGHGSAIEQMLAAMNTGGRIAMLGIPPHEIAIDWNEVIFKGLTIQGIYGRKMYETWYKMIAMLESGLDISDVVTHHFDIDDYNQGFDAMNSGQCGKVILDWNVNAK